MQDPSNIKLGDVDAVEPPPKIDLRARQREYSRRFRAKHAPKPGEVKESKQSAKYQRAMSMARFVERNPKILAAYEEHLKPVEIDL